MSQIAAGEFKAKCLQLMERVRRTREEITITKFGRPVAKLVPSNEPLRKPLFGFLKGQATYRDDLIRPTGERWSADA
jgi:prevent-host-death family protein